MKRYVQKYYIIKIRCVKVKTSRSFYLQDIISIENIERIGKKMNRHVALFSVSNTYDSDEYNILDLFSDNQIPERVDLSN